MEIVDDGEREAQLAIPAMATMGAVRSYNFRSEKEVSVPKPCFERPVDLRMDVESGSSPVFKSNPLPIFLKVCVFTCTPSLIDFLRVSPSGWW